MTIIELHFPVLDTSIPTDHGYGLYSALSRLLPSLHEKTFPAAIGPIAGDYIGQGMMRMNSHSRLRLRLPTEMIPTVLPLAGRQLDLEGQKVRLGVPQVRALIPAASLVAKIVTIKGFKEPAAFLDAVRRQLAELEIAGEPAIPLIQEGPRAGEPRRRILRIKDKRVVGFTLQVTGLTAEESLNLQEKGLGGRPKMGCGFFVAMGARAELS